MQLQAEEYWAAAADHRAGQNGEPRGRLELLDGCAISLKGRPAALPLTSQRVLALLALHDRPLQRTYVAGMLWPDYPEHRSVANLRTALARLPLQAGRLVDVMGRRSRGGTVLADIRYSVRPICGRSVCRYER